MQTHASCVALLRLFGLFGHSLLTCHTQMGALSVGELVPGLSIWPPIPGGEDSQRISCAQVESPTSSTFHLRWQNQENLHITKEGSELSKITQLAQGPPIVQD